MKIFVAGLPYDMDDAELEEFFEKFGTVSSVKVAMDRETGKSKGFGFVEMPNDAEGQKAIDELNNADYEGKTITVTIARPKTDRGSGGYNNRGGNGGFNGNRY